MRFLSGSVLAILAIAHTGYAQSGSDRFTVNPRFGYIAFDKASGLESSPYGGLSVQYQIGDMIGIGLTGSGSRPQTRGEDFIAALYLGDTTFLYEVTQPVTMLDLGLEATIKLPVSRFSPYLTGGVGSYTLYLDPQANSRPEKFQRMSMMFGGGVNLRFGDRFGVLLDLRDHIFTNYRRDRLNPVNSAALNTRFFEDFPAPPASKETVHNFAFSLGFSFVPSTTTSAEGTDR
jgi:hypothetical protein